MEKKGRNKRNFTYIIGGYFDTTLMTDYPMKEKENIKIQYVNFFFMTSLRQNRINKVIHVDLTKIYEKRSIKDKISINIESDT